MEYDLDFAVMPLRPPQAARRTLFSSDFGWSATRAVKRARRNACRVKKPGDHGTRHDGPPTIQLANPVLNKTMTSIAA